MAETLIDLLLAAVARAADRPALVHGDCAVSYAELDRASAAFAARLAAAGVQPGDRVLICLPNAPAFVAGLLGVLRAGAVGVPLNPLYREREIAAVAADCAPVALLADADSAAAVAAAPHAPALRFVVAPGAALDPLLFGAAGVAPPPPEPADLALLVYTSGTTGLPKGAMLSHANVAAGARIWQQGLALPDAAPVLALAPLFHVTGLTGHIGLALAAAAPLLLGGRFEAGRMLDIIERHRPHFTVGAITAFAALVDHPAFAPHRVSGFRLLASGGAPIAPALAARIGAAMGVPVRNAYGLTETSAPVTLVPAGAPAPTDPLSGALSIGQAVPGCRLTVIDDAGQPLPDGMAGELVVEGPGVSAGYWNNAAATAEAMRPHGFHTGDVAIRNGEGWFFLVDRKKDMIVASGFKVWPREVEDVIHRLPGVREVAVVGIPHAYRGETVKAVLSLLPGAQLGADDVSAFCRLNLAAYKCPTHIHFMEELPKTPTGKILRRALREEEG